MGLTKEVRRRRREMLSVVVTKAELRRRRAMVFLSPRGVVVDHVGCQQRGISAVESPLCTFIALYGRCLRWPARWRRSRGASPGPGTAARVPVAPGILAALYSRYISGGPSRKGPSLGAVTTPSCAVWRSLVLSHKRVRRRLYGLLRQLAAAYSRLHRVSRPSPFNPIPSQYSTLYRTYLQRQFQPEQKKKKTVTLPRYYGIWA